MHRRIIVTGAFYAASWDLMEAVKTATLIYAPLSFGDYVRITGTFLKLSEPIPTTDSADQEVSDQLKDNDIAKSKEDSK
jgi:hypothetical protein